TAHLAVPAFDDSGDPATLSRPILTGLLREELGYEGVIITDSLEMEGVRQKYGDAEVAVRALEAGADQLLMSPALQKALPAVVERARRAVLR
ncbi:MAG: glycoside hydrolase family 3 N-terminal domain-containing protein, partial [Brevundimonas sp.]